MTKRGRVFWYGLAALLLVAGVALAVAISGTLGQVLGFVLIAFGLIVATSLVFLEVGLSEDRERQRERQARERQARERQAQATEHDDSVHQDARRSRVRLPRTRGRRRRLT